MNREEETDGQLKKLTNLGRPEIEKLVKIFSHQTITGTKSELANYLLEHYRSDVSTFLENLQKLSFVHSYVARNYLKDCYPDKSRRIANIRKKDQVLIFLYENDIISEIDDVVFYCSFRGKELRNAYNLKTETDLNYEQITEKLDDFVTVWNESNTLKISTRQHIATDDKLVVTILREHNQKTYCQFRFRDPNFNFENNTENLELSKTKIFPVWPESMEFNKDGKGSYSIIFDFDPVSEKTIINLFINTIFGPNSILEKTEIKSVKEIQKEIKQAITKSPNWEGIEKIISDRKPPIIKRIKADRSLSKERRSRIIKIINTIHYAGPSFKDDPKTTTKELTMKVGNIGKLFSILPTAKSFIQELFSKVSKSTENQLISVNNKEILLIKKSIKFPPLKLSEDEKLALKLFLGED